MRNILLILSILLIGCTSTKEVAPLTKYKIDDRGDVFRIFENKNLVGQIIENNSPWVDGSSYLDSKFQIRSTSIKGSVNKNTLEVYDYDGPIGAIQNINSGNQDNILIIKDYLNHKIYRSVGVFSGNKERGPLEILDGNNNTVLLIKYYGNNRWMILKYGDINPDIFLNIVRFSGSHPLL